ncbi:MULTISPECIES: hypothetical protein [unclassified Moorena]|nr:MULTISPECIES: hypothetical protein [unclassified Moorena]NEO24815.1 hypothetical protein [Moorena sp. SIO4A5]
MPIPQQDAHSTTRCPFHNKMPIPQQDAHSTTRCPFHNKMPIPQQDAHSTHQVKQLLGDAPKAQGSCQWGFVPQPIDNCYRV